MSNYPKIRHILASAFAIDVGLSEIAQRQLLERFLANEESRTSFQRELLDAFSDEHTSWTELLSNAKYEVVEADSEQRAREIAAGLLWEPTFPGQPLPQIEQEQEK